jgi:hypothetical protein
MGFTLCGAVALGVAYWANKRPAIDSRDQAEVEVEEIASRPA